MEVLAPGTVARVQAGIRDAIGLPRYNLWFNGHTKVELVDGALEIGVPNRFYREWLERHFQAPIGQALQEVIGESVPIRFRIDPSLFRRCHSEEEIGEPKPVRATPAAKPADQGSGLSARFGITDFVVGSSNQVAHAAATAFIDNPRAAFSPLLIQAGVGLGKSHLIKATTHGVRQRHRSLRTLAMSCEEFGNDYVEAVRTGTLNAFRRKLRHADILIVDDVQFLAGKRGMQEEFLHTLNSLQTRNAKIVVACDQHPRRLPKMTEELRSRLVSGMVVRIEPPNSELRRQILAHKANARELRLTKGALDYLANNLRSNLYELEGALNYLQHYCETFAAPLDEATTQTVLAEVVRHASPVLRVGEVKRKACELFDLSPRMLRQKSRSRLVSYPRMLVLYLCRKFTHATYSEIGQEVGGLNHSSVIAAEKKVQSKLAADGEIVLGSRPWKVRDAIEAFERELGRG